MDELYYIYKKDGSKIRIGGTDAEPKYLSVNQLQYDGTFLGQSHISFTLKTPIAIPFEGQEYLTIDDEKYTLKYVPSFKKQARPKEYSESFVYDNIIMQSQIDDTTRVDFLDYVLEDNTIHYSAMPTVYFYGTVIDLAKRIQANLDRVYTGDKKWTIKLPTDTSSLPTVEKQIMYQNKKVWDAITDIWNQYKVLFYSRGTTLYIGYSEETIGNNFKYGIGKGLKSLERKTDESNAIITRLHAYGSKVNLPSRYYNTLGTTVKPNLPITIVGGDGVNRQLWFKVDDVTMDMFKDSTDFSYTGTGPTNPTDPQVDVYVTKTVTFTATKKQISTTDGVCLFVDCNSLGWSYADYRWLYWAMYKGGNTVTVLSSVVVSYIPNKYLYNANVYASDSMYLPNLMLPLIRTNSDTIKYYDASFNEITDSTKAYYRMVRTGNNSKGLDIYIDSIKGIEKYGVMEGNITFDNNTDNNIIDLVDDENGICPTITKLSTSTGSDASKIVSATQLTDSGIPNSAGSLDVTTFDVVVNVGFNPNNYLIVGETAQISMKSGTCIGRTFDFNCAANTDGTYTLTCNRIVDSSMQIGFPNAEYNIKPDDTFVFLGIQLPEEYIVSAENRLLSAGLKYISKFDHTKNIYAPELDNIFLENNKNVRKSILAGNIFQFIDSEINGVDNNNEGILIALPISQSTVKIGYSMIREYSITLAENIDIKTNSYQRTLDSVKDYFTSNIENIGYNQIGSISYSYVKDKFLSKEKDDRTGHSLGVGGKLSVDNDLRIGSFRNGLLGSGALIDAKGNAEFDSITARTFMAAKSFLYNLIEVNIGERWSTNGFCKIKSVDTVSKIITEELDENQYSSMQVGDGCRAIYCDIDGKYTTSDSSADNCGFPTKKGFFTSYFMVSEIVESGKGYCSFRYALRNSSTPEPCALMQAAQYFSFTNENRRSSIYECNYPHSYIMTLEGVSTWEIQSANIVKVDGWLNDISITLNNGNTTTLSGKGLYVQDNVYLGNAIIQLDPMTLKDLQDELNNYTVDLDCNADLLQVDANGNVVGGLWKEETSTTAKDSSGNAIKYKQYLIHSAIYVKRNGAILIEAEGSDDASEGTYKVYMTCDGCTAELHNSTIYLTCINGVHDGVASTTEVETDEWYKAMLKIDHVSVTVAIDCEGKGTITKTLNLPIKHINDVMALADLTNETTNIVFSKKQSSYVGFGNSDSVLTVKHGTELMTITEVKFGMVDKVTSTFNDKTSNITFSCSLSDDTLSDSFSIPITVTALYKGISYERTIQKKFIKIAGNTSYELSPSVSAISASYDATGAKVMSPTSVSCGIKCYDDTDGNYVLSTDKYSERKLAISYIVNDGNETAYTEAISTTSTMTKLIFVLKMDGSEIDRETIYVNSDGKDGVTYWCNPQDVLIPSTKQDDLFTVIDALNLTITFHASKDGVELTAGNISQVEDVENVVTSADLYDNSSDKNKPNGTLTLICDGGFRNGTLNVTVPFTDANGKAYTHVYPIIVQANVKGTDGADAVNAICTSDLTQYADIDFNGKATSASSVTYFLYLKMGDSNVTITSATVNSALNNASIVNHSSYVTLNISWVLGYVLKDETYTISLTGSYNGTSYTRTVSVGFITSKTYLHTAYANCLYAYDNTVEHKANNSSTLSKIFYGHIIDSVNGYRDCDAIPLKSGDYRIYVKATLIVAAYRCAIMSVYSSDVSASNMTHLFDNTSYSYAREITFSGFLSDNNNFRNNSGKVVKFYFGLRGSTTDISDTQDTVTSVKDLHIMAIDVNNFNYTAGSAKGTYSDKNVGISEYYSAFTKWELTTPIKGEPRKNTSIVTGTEYCNYDIDGKTDVDGNRWVDILSLSSSSYLTGYAFYTCKGYHKAAATYSTDTDFSSDTSESAYWAIASQSMLGVYSFLIAKNAVLDFIATQKVIFRDSSGYICASINQDGVGEYKTYYPTQKDNISDAQPRIVIDGIGDNSKYITYYSDNNKILWRMGTNGYEENFVWDDYNFYSGLSSMYSGGVLPSSQITSKATQVYIFSCKNSKADYYAYNGWVYNYSCGKITPDEYDTSVSVVSESTYMTQKRLLGPDGTYKYYYDFYVVKKVGNYFFATYMQTGKQGESFPVFN